LKPLKGQVVGVIGFNARPIACSLSRLGAEVVVSDYWGDDDLVTCCKKWVAVLNPQPGERQRTHIDRPVHEALIENFLNVADRNVEMVVIGSGFDDHPDVLATLKRNYRVAANSIGVFRRARDRRLLKQLATNAGLRYPTTIEVKSPRELEHAIASMGFPALVRPSNSGGGSRVRLIVSEDQLTALTRRLAIDHAHPLLVQQYVRGRDYSMTIIGTEGQSQAISVQAQLIGIPAAGRDCDFVYCGNYCPVRLEATQSQLTQAMEEIASRLELVGYNGIDFVVDDNGEMWLLEVNPRITGTLELLEVASGVNLMEWHLRALEGLLPDGPLQARPTVKMIVYSTVTGIVPDLSQFPGTMDKTPQGTLVRRGDPICTVMAEGETIAETYRTAAEVAQKIQGKVMKV